MTTTARGKEGSQPGTIVACGAAMHTCSEDGQIFTHEGKNAVSLILLLLVSRGASTHDPSVKMHRDGR